MRAVVRDVAESDRRFDRLWHGGEVTGDRADLQAQFSLAYVQAVASAAGLFVQQSDRGYDKDGVDLSVMSRQRHGFFRSPRLELQVKSRAGVAEAGSIFCDLSVKNYDELRESTYQVPRILVLVLVPDDAADWLRQSEDELALRRCAYWLSLRGRPATMNAVSTRVSVPRQQRLGADELKLLLARIADGGAP